MIDAPDRPKAIELPSLTTEETALMERIKSGTAGKVTFKEFLEFISRRRDIVDALVREVYPEWEK